jgi:hypothetical protein
LPTRAARRPAVELDGDDLRPLPLFERRRAIYAASNRVPGIQIIEHGEALFHAILDGDH